MFYTNKLLNTIIILMIFLLLITPVTYFLATTFNTKFLYNYKDIICVIFLIPAILSLKSNASLMLLSIYFICLGLYPLIITNTNPDILFYLLSVRELALFPLAYIIVGYYLSINSQKHFYRFIYTFLVICFVLTVFYILIQPQESFSTVLRLKSFWEREHECAIISGLLFIILYINRINLFFKLPMLFITMALALLSGSRCAIFGVFFVVALIELKNKNWLKASALILSFISILALFPYTSLAHRTLAYNINPRIEQYTLAKEGLVQSNLLGIGSDKYGRVGNYIKEYKLNNKSTTTMDSSIFKYSLNYGVFYIIPFICSFMLILFMFLLSSVKDSQVYSVIIFSIIIGLVTGKLGAYPLNLIFYSCVGFVCSKIKITNSQGASCNV